MGGNRKPLIIRVDTRESGVTPSDTFRIPANAPGETYRFKVDWGDGAITSNHTGNAEHTYLSGGVYDIKIYGKFPRFYFNNTGDRLKLLEVLDWGGIKYSADQANAFYGCSNLTFIATDENSWYNGITLGNSMFNGNSLTSLPTGMTLSNLTNGNSMFRDNSLTSLPDVMLLSNLTSGNNMFNNNSLTSLPTGMTLSSLTSGISMFNNNSLTSLPDGMLLGNLTGGFQMFQNNSLTSLPDSMTLSSLTNGSNMFNGNSLTSLPDGMTLGNLTIGTSMFQNNSLTSAIGLNLHKINTGVLFMNLANLPVSQYSNILVDIEANNPNNEVTIDFGTSEYNATGQIARNLLTSAPRDWVITDGGLE